MPALLTPRRAQRLRNAIIALGALLWIASLAYPPTETTNLSLSGEWYSIGHRPIWTVLSPPPRRRGLPSYRRPNWPVLLFEWSAIGAVIVIPYWLIGIATSRDPRRCRECGYDLAGLQRESRREVDNSAGVMCPECGCRNGATVG